MPQPRSSFGIMSRPFALAAALSLAIAVHAAGADMTVQKSEDGAAYTICEAGQPVLRYNYQAVSPPAGFKERLSPGNAKYGVARCDYIHPLYGLAGQILTDDWVVDHPHHRGIYWAWPEVDWNGQRGDLHALQTVFARPTGKIAASQGADFAQIDAESEWRWDDRTPIVRETAVIRAYARNEKGRCIDLSFRFAAIDASVQVARRGTTHYGGLNVRLSPAADQHIVTLADPATALPRRAWAHRSGTVRDANAPAALTILQNALNPEYPGDWVQFPILSWVQPTFPTAGSRYRIAKDKPLELRYRLWVHDKEQDAKSLEALWAEYDAAQPQPIDAPFRAIMGYKVGQSRAGLIAVQDLLRAAARATRARIERNLIALLQSADVTVDAKVFACQQLAQVGTDACVEAVAPLLADKALAHAARYALLPLRSERADEALRNALSKATGGALVGLLNVLAERRDEKAVPAIIPLLANQDPAVAGAAMHALGCIGGAGAADALAQVNASEQLRQTLGDARILCAERLAAAGNADGAAAIYRRELADAANSRHIRVAALRGVVSVQKEKSLEELTRLAAEQDARLRQEAVGLMLTLRGDAVIQSLARVLHNGPADLQAMILRQLADRPDASALADEVASLARSENAAVREAAASALGTLGQARQVALLIDLAAEKSPLAITAMASLARLRAPDVDVELLRLISAGDEAHRIAVIRALAERRFAGASPALLDIAKQSNPALGVEAFKALGAAADAAALPAMAQSLASCDNACRAAAVEAMVHACRRNNSGAAPLLDVLKQTQGAGRLPLILAIGPLGGADALKAVATALNDPDTAMQDAAMESLARWPDGAALEPLLAAAGAHPRENLRILAIRNAVALLRNVTIPAAEQLKAFGQLLKCAKRAQERKMVLSALAEVRTLDAMDLAASLLDDADAKNEAAIAVINIALGDKDNPQVLRGPRVIAALKKVRPLVNAQTQQRVDEGLAAAAAADEANLALGRPVKTSVNHQGNFRPELAVDGHVDLRSYWSGDRTPAWLSVDLGSVVKIGRAVVVFHWGGRRYYQYTIDISEDGQTWRTVVDQTKNTALSTPAGFAYQFDAAPARYVRVNILKNSANPGAHIVELKVFAAQ